MRRKYSPRGADQPGCKPTGSAKQGKRTDTIANSGRSRKPAPLASLNDALDPAFWESARWQAQTEQGLEP
jgi:hypothetical protein